MPITILILSAVLLPLLWGWAMHRLMAKVWPEGQPGAGRGGEIDPSSPPPLDYQI